MTASGRRPLLAGFGVDGFRSFGSGEIQRVGPMTGVHLLAGPNGAGKSNVLRAMSVLLPALGGDTPPALDPQLDKPSGDPLLQASEPRVRVALGIFPTEADAEALGPPYPRVSFTRLLEILGTGASDGSSSQDPDPTLCWFEFEHGTGQTWTPSRRQCRKTVAAAEATGEPDLLGRLATWYPGRRGSDEENAALVLSHAVDRLAVRSGLPEARLVVPLRRMSDSPSGAGDDANRPYPEHIARLILPGIERTAADERVREMNDLVRFVLGESSFSLEPDFDAKQLFVRLEGRPVRPLDSHGSGLEQLVLLAYEATAPGEALVLMEEPEAHLHPAMQRRLLDRLAADRTKQYVIATHSPHLLDSARGSITSVRQDGGWSRLAPAVRPAEVARVARELGARASDLVQSNAVVWVEGPSDRVYLRHWLRSVEQRLVEGVHYSIMWYGGALLSRLAADDTILDELVALPRLNREFAIVVDSDSQEPEGPLQPAKRRLLDRLAASAADLHVWVTEGYTIENYACVEDLRAAVDEVHPRARFEWDGDLHRNPLAPPQFDQGSPRKVDIAEAYVRLVGDRPGWASNTDARERTEALAKHLRHANDMSDQP